MLKRGISLLFVLIFVSSARAAQSVIPIIVDTTVNAAQTQITISGEGFGTQLPLCSPNPRSADDGADTLWV